MRADRQTSRCRCAPATKLLNAVSQRAADAPHGVSQQPTDQLSSGVCRPKLMQNKSVYGRSLAAEGDRISKAQPPREARPAATVLPLPHEDHPYIDGPCHASRDGCQVLSLAPVAAEVRPGTLSEYYDNFYILPLGCGPPPSRQRSREFPVMIGTAIRCHPFGWCFKIAAGGAAVATPRRQAAHVLLCGDTGWAGQCILMTAAPPVDRRLPPPLHCGSHQPPN